MKNLWEWQDRGRCRTIDLASVPRIATLVESEDEPGKPAPPEYIPEVLTSVTDVFYVEDWEEEKVERAKGYCEACPVRDDCLDFALGMREREGIWGGTTGNERRAILNKKRKAGEEIPRYSQPMPRGVGVD